MDAWLDAVAEFGRRAWAAQVDWMLVGSAASAMQGAPLTPGDVDVLARTPAGVARLAGHLHDLARPEPSGTTREEFWSSHRVPLLSWTDDGLVWTLGRWEVHGVPLEIIHIAGPETGLVETWGTRVWSVRSDIIRENVTAPCVPLEVQVATSLVSGDTARRRVLTDTLAQREPNAGLLVEALTARGYRPATIDAHPEVWRLLPTGLRPAGRRTGP